VNFSNVSGDTDLSCETGTAGVKSALEGLLFGVVGLLVCFSNFPVHSLGVPAKVVLARELPVAVLNGALD